MTSQTPIGSTKIPLALPYGTLAVGDASGTLWTTTPTLPGYRMAQSGWVIGIAENMSGTLNTGTLTFYPTKNGSPMTNNFANGTLSIGTTGYYERDQAQQGGFAFTAGDVLGVGFTKSGTIQPTTNDLNVLLLVLLDQYDY